MIRDEIVAQVRTLIRDGARALFNDATIILEINNGIQRIRQRIPMLRGMVALTDRFQAPILLPEEYHHLLCLYSASRLFFIDERHYQAGNMMNEFEIKLDELKASLLNGEVDICDGTGAVVPIPNFEDYVVDNYFLDNNNFVDVDEGVEGVE